MSDWGWAYSSKKPEIQWPWKRRVLPKGAVWCCVSEAVHRAPPKGEKGDCGAFGKGDDVRRGRFRAMDTTRKNKGEKKGKEILGDRETKIAT